MRRRVRNLAVMVRVLVGKQKEDRKARIMEATKANKHAAVELVKRLNAGFEAKVTGEQAYWCMLGDDNYAM